MIDRGFNIGKIFGIKINIDWSWIFIFLLITWNLALGLFPAIHPEWGMFLHWAVGLSASLLFFSSVLVHELAHSLVARSRGIPVKSITLFLFGGVAGIEQEPQSPRTEFLMAIVGPITSIVLGAVFIFLAGASPGSLGDFISDPLVSLSELNPLSTLLLWLGPINILLGIFNLIPGFPLDGGRVLRSIIWNITGDLKKATRYASWAGQGVGFLFMIIGVAMILGIEVPFFGSGVLGGLWLAFIGWFLNSAASQSYQKVILEHLLGNVPVSRLMNNDVPTVSPHETVDELVHKHIMGTDKYAFPVMEDGNLEGIVSLEDVRKIPNDIWRQRKINQIMVPIDELDVTHPREKVSDAMNKLMKRDVGQLPVVEDGRLIGMLRRRDILVWLQLHS